MKVRSHLAFMAAAILLPVVLFSGLALNQFLEAERAAVLRSMTEAARATTLAIDQEWSYAEGVGRVLATSPALADEEFSLVHARAKLANSGKALHTVVINSEGQQILNTALPYGQPIAGPSQATLDRVRQVLSASAPQISNLIVGRATGKPIVTIEMPVTAKSGRSYVFSNWMYAADLNKAFPSKGIPPSWLIGIFDRQGVTIARNRGPEGFVGKQPKEDLLQAILTTDQTYIRNQSRDGLELYTVLARSPYSGWTVAVGVPAVEIEATARHAVLLASLGLLGAIGIALCGAMLFGRRLVNAIDRTAHAAALLGHGALPSVTVSNIVEVDKVNLALREAGKALQSTEQERNALLETARKAQVLAEKQNKAKDEFLAMLGHELRNPLSAITASVSLIDRHDVTPEAARRGYEVIKRQSGQLTHIVDELLDASRVITGKVTLSKQRLDLGETARSCLDASQARGLMTRYEVQTRIASVFVDADPTRLAQIINNLLENAFKYTPEGGRVALEVSKEDQQAVIRVSDSGIGISPELLPHVFDVFVQAPASLNRAKGGLGIGLAVVQAMAQQHAGRVSVQSVGEGHGSCFEVRLPIAPEGATAGISARTLQFTGAGSSRLLLIDDNDDARSTLSELLELYGFAVMQANDGQSGVRLAKEQLPDCAIIDIGLPDIDGYQVVRGLRADARTAGMNLIALTGYGQMADKQLAIEAGFNHHLTKPVDIDELVEAIAQLPSSVGVSA